MLKKIHVGYLILTIAMSIGLYYLSILIYPANNANLAARLVLVGAVAIGVTTVLANLRTILEPTIAQEKGLENNSQLVIHQIIHPPINFTGREKELSEFVAIWKSGKHIGLAIFGMGGCGKTALALKLSSQIKRNYPDGGLYFDLQGFSEQQPNSPINVMKTIIQTLEPAIKLPDGDEEIRGIYVSIMSSKSVLLVLDNAAGQEQAEKLCLPENTFVIITSRNHFSMPGIYTHNLSALDDKNSEKLLLSLSPRIDSYAPDLAIKCGYLPYALCLAGKTLAEYPNIEVPFYLEKLKQESARLPLIEAPLKISYDLLSARLQSHWRLLGVFPSSFDIQAAMNIVKKSEETVLDEISLLVRLSLVDWVQIHNRYQLHDLARVFAKSRQTSSEKRRSVKRFIVYYGSFIQRLLSYPETPEAELLALNLFRLEEVNTHKGQDLLAQYKRAKLDVDTENIPPEAVLGFDPEIAWQWSALIMIYFLGFMQKTTFELKDLQRRVLEKNDNLPVRLWKKIKNSFSKKSDGIVPDETIL